MMDVPKTHDLCPKSGFRQSSYLQETCLYVGQSEVYSQSEALLSRLCGVSLSAKQIEHLVHHYGAVLEDEFSEQSDIIVPPVAEVYYAMVDGSYILSREDGWVETKLGRIFSADSAVPISEKRRGLLSSTYVGHIGSHTDFCRKMNPILGRYQHLVFIADGATWIWKWVKECYPYAIQILDFFHAFEKICQWVALVYKDDTLRKDTCLYMEELLRNSQLSALIQYLHEIDCKGEILEKRTCLIRYLENNRCRMDYKRYVEEGYLIGSGAIESANRNVIQQRMKRSGQRWTKDGGQQILNIRAAYLSNQWTHVQDIVRNAA